jgi:two-component system cell cycle sensor histidine kinase/response regulator CckA
MESSSDAQQCILIADDKQPLRTYVRRILQMGGFHVVEASDGMEALEVLQQGGGQIDLLVTDVRMPRMDGVALAQAVSSLYPDTPVLFISGYAFDLESEPHKRLAKRCGFLQKPFLPKALLEAVRKCLASPDKASQTTA